MTAWTRSLDELPTDPVAAARLAGGKAANLAVMRRDLGLPVPPAFVVTTEACRAFLASGWPDGLVDELRERMRALEAAMGRGFGDPADPLLVSVRSGAPVSMPGMMDTILDLGLNDETTSGLGTVTGDMAFAAACRVRLEAGFRDIVGVDRAPDDPWIQLRWATEAVFRSWGSDRAVAYRAREGIADDLGTAVTVQAMVFGNRGATSATGVLFTRDPATGAPTPYGDVLFGAQGEDVVAGTHLTEPIAVLDVRLPAVAADLRRAASILERHYADLCDIEFTIEESRLWLLQVRVGKRSPGAAIRIARDLAEDPEVPLDRAGAVRRVATLLADPPRIATSRSHLVLPIATGLPASPGVASGPIVTTPEAAVAAVEAGARAILVREATSPDDVHGLAAAAGILTAHGGLASHAAVVARGWGIPAVVGVEGLHLLPTGAVGIGDRTLHPGDIVTIDGASGEVFAGAIPASSEIVPEALELIAWARELGIEIPAPSAADEPLDARSGGARSSIPVDACIRVVAIKGFATVDGVADALLATPDAVRPVLDQLVLDGLLASSAGALKLAESGIASSAELLAADRAALGDDAATAALDAFVAIDREVKSVVTAWQVRDEAAGVLNDHADTAYDAAVIDRLGDVHATAEAWIEPLTAHLARLGDYRRRLDRALAAARAGDGRFVASPRVDSYHGAWFELHEDLIRLAGRTREDEVAAGRA